LLADLGVTKTHSRPHVSDDNPFSESQFKTLKYRPEFPQRFGSTHDARGFCQVFFPWYNTEHHHSGIGLLTPEVLHHGRADDVIGQRQVVLGQAFQRNPERFVRAHPRPPARLTAVWINPPPARTASEQEQHQFMRAGVSKSLTNSVAGHEPRVSRTVVACNQTDPHAIRGGTSV
jgi:putative transposase